MAIGRLRLKPMSYDFPPWRPPSEANSLLVRVTRGCTWNRCTFCSMYKQFTFERRPVDDVKADILAAASLYSAEVRSVFIGDSNSPSIKTADVADILHQLSASFPALERVTSYARAKTLLKKPLDDLRQLRQAGLTTADIDFLVPHQANLRIIEGVRSPLHVPPEKAIVNIDRVGNTSSASIPIALGEARDKGLIKRGDRIVMVAFGGGLTWGALLLKY